MQFVYPGFLFALSAVLIPVIIHLFHFRRFQKVYFPNISFLQHLSDESRRQSRLKHLLVLATRMLVVSFLVLAFARPYVPSEATSSSQQGNAVAVYLDNSFSMEALGRSGTLLDQAKEHARKITGQYSPGDHFMLLTSDFEARHQRWLAREEFLLMLQEVEITPAVRSVAEAVKRTSELMLESPGGKLSSYYISDFQKSTAAIEEIVADSVVDAYFIPLEAQNSSNIYVDSLWFESPARIIGQPLTLKVRVHNETDQDLESQPLRLNIAGQQRAVASFDAPAGGEAVVELTWTIKGPDDQSGMVELLDYPVTFDDQAFFSFPAAAGIPVLAVNQDQPAPFLEALFANDSVFHFSGMALSTMNASALGQNNLVILNNLNSIAAGLASQLLQFVEQGGSLVIFPGVNLDAGSYQRFLASLNVDHYGPQVASAMRVTGLNEQHEVFTGVFETIPENIDLPQVQQYYPIERSQQSGGQFLLQLQNGHPFFSSYVYGKGRVFLSAVPLDDRFSNLPRHPIFVPLMANIAMQSQLSQPLYYLAGENQPVVIPGQTGGREDLYVLKGPEVEIIPEQQPGGGMTRLFFHHQVKQAGNYQLTFNDQPAGSLSFNYHRQESSLDAWTASQLEDLLLDHGLEHIEVIATAEADGNLALQQVHLGDPLWRYFLIGALVLLLAEVALLRFWR